jgi:hypothetical protein
VEDEKYSTDPLSPGHDGGWIRHGVENADAMAFDRSQQASPCSVMIESVDEVRQERLMCVLTGSAYIAGHLMFETSV